ncbi:MAG: hypothetical protein NTW14_03695 [bacterium]|nr:hypothetical protein [bacterium]
MGKLRIRYSENEFEAEGDEKFIELHMKRFYEKIEGSSTQHSTTKSDELEDAPPKIPEGKIPTPAEFYKAKGKTDGLSQILVFGKYLELYRMISEFTKLDINGIAKEVKLSKDIHSQYFTNAVKQGLLRSHGQGKYSLTLSAEKILSALPPMP